MPFDVNDPPVEPPVGCQSGVAWRLARKLWQAHRPDDSGFCLDAGCRSDNQMFPCRAARLAIDGMNTACGTRSDTSLLWISVTRRRLGVEEVNSSPAIVEVLCRYDERPPER
jgi:hypothetical protein